MAKHAWRLRPGGGLACVFPRAAARAALARRHLNLGPDPRSFTHGLIRTAHAVRSFPKDAKPSNLEIDELARGLAYWASAYRPLPGNPNRHGRLEIDEALRRLQRLDSEKRKGPPAAALNGMPGFASAVESLAPATDAKEAISRHTAAFARVLIAHPEVPPIPLVHAITAPTAMQNLLP